MNIASPAFALTVSDEIKAGAVFFVKMSIGVVISALIIGIGLWIYSRFKLQKEKTGMNISPAEKFTCETDDTKTMAEAIKTFLTVNR